MTDLSGQTSENAVIINKSIYRNIFSERKMQLPNLRNGRKTAQNRSVLITVDKLFSLRCKRHFAVNIIQSRQFADRK